MTVVDTATDQVGEHARRPRGGYPTALAAAPLAVQRLYVAALRRRVGDQRWPPDQVVEYLRDPADLCAGVWRRARSMSLTDLAISPDRQQGLRHPGVCLPTPGRGPPWR